LKPFLTFDFHRGCTGGKLNLAAGEWPRASDSSRSRFNRFQGESMAPATQILLSGCLTFGVPLAAAIYDLFSTNRGPSGPDWRPDPPEPQDPGPIRGGSPEGKALPQCLLDAAMGNRVRELV
jgi:hypothetical protein